MEIQAGLTRVLARLEEARAELQAAQERVHRLEVMRDGLQFAVDEFEMAQAADETAMREQERELADAVNTASAASEPAGHGLPGIPDSPAPGAVTQADLVLAALTALDGPATTKEVRQRLVAAGYDRSYEQVRGALKWLKESDRVGWVGPGTWALPEKMPQEDLSPAVSAAGASKAEENGHVLFRPS